ncbi:MAG TPA: AMP-binding protein [Pyrinomonadaceae bacterium]|nr:AMP-binding protein [Pyrinomonadaceae bacterium]
MHDTNVLENQPIAWTPSPEVIERAQLTKFMRQVGVSTWDELYQYSISDVEKFTEEVLKFLEIKFDPPYEKLLDTSNGVEFPNWLAASPQRRGDAEMSEPKAAATGSPAHAGLNITQMCLDRWQTDEMKDQPAVIWEGEDGGVTAFTYEKLAFEVTFCTAALRQQGFSKGDAIGIHLPMVPETIIALLAIARIGAVAIPVFSGYGVSAIEARLNAVNAKALFTCDGFQRRGKVFDAFSIARQAVSSCPSIEKVYVVRLTQSLDDAHVPDDLFGKYIYFRSLCEGGGWSSEEQQSVEPTSAEDPLIILYTSGTTGKPKGIAHTHASFPIKAAQDMAFGTDVGKGTRICWYTDIGWMMGPWLIYGALINGATICIYDGAPDYPTPDRMWEFCAKHKVEVLGISPTLIRALSNCGDDLPKKHDLSSLRAFASTGEPWNPAPWWWLFEKVGNSKLPIINYSGGTEISGGILMGNPLLPQKPCSFPAPCPGMDVDILDEQGQPVGPNQVGELVIKQPWIGMARGFWQEKERYLDTYWRRFKGIWVHGDWAMRDNDGHWFILGRSDDTLKVAGKRVGPAEVESILVSHPSVVEAAVIGVPDEAKGTAMVAFCVLTGASDKGQGTRDEESSSSSLISHPSSLEAELRALVARDMGKPLAPSKIHFVSALPKTRNAKVMRRVLRSAYLGEDAGDLSSLENPQSVDEIKNAKK